MWDDPSAWGLVLGTEGTVAVAGVGEVNAEPFSRRLLSHWQHESVDDDALELLEESNMVKLSLTPEQARLAFGFIQVQLSLPMHCLCPAV
jgi:hypothetical protein